MRIDTLFWFSISRLLGYNPHFHNLSLRITVYSRPIQRKGQFGKDLPAVKCKYLILSVKKMFPIKRNSCMSNKERTEGRG